MVVRRTGGAFEYMVHKGAPVDVILGAEYQRWDVSSFAFLLLATPPKIMTSAPRAVSSALV